MSANANPHHLIALEDQLPTFLRRIAPVVLFLLGCSTKPSVDDAPSALYRLEVIAASTSDSLDTQWPFMGQSGPGGTVYVSSQSLTGLVAILDSAGGFLRSLGHGGQGPGEFVRSMFFVTKGDSLVVTDMSQAGAKLFAPEGRYIRSLPPSMKVVGGLFVRGDSFVVPGNIRSDGAFGLPMHLFDPDGRLVRSFGAEDRTVDPTRRRLDYLLAPESDSTYWVARYSEYRIELWDTKGKVLKSLKLSRSWYPDQPVGERGRIDNVRPAGSIVGFQRDVHGHLLLLSYRARADWSGKPYDGNGERPGLLPSEFMKFVEEVVEVVDTATGELRGEVVNRRDPLVGFLADGRVFGFRADSLGRHLPVTWRLVHPPR